MTATLPDDKFDMAFASLVGVTAGSRVLLGGLIAGPSVPSKTFSTSAVPPMGVGTTLLNTG